MKTYNIFALSIIIASSFIFYSCNKNEYAPEIVDQEFNLNENSVAGTLVGKIDASDRDEGQKLTFEIIDGNLDGTFELDPDDGILSVSNSTKLDYEKIQEFLLTVSVSDNHDKDPLESTASVKINLKDVNEFAPTIEDQSFEINENPAYQQEIGEIFAFDEDTYQNIYFKIIGEENADYVQIDSVSGNIFVNDSSAFDFEKTQTISFKVEVRDDHSNSLSKDATITININNVKEVITDGLVGYYPLDGNAVDESGNGNNGTVNSPSIVPDMHQEENGAFEFNGVDNFISFGDIFDNIISGEDKQFSFSFWMNPNSTNTNAKSIIAKNADSNCGVDERQFSIQLNQENRLHFIWGHDLMGTSYKSVLGNTIIENNNWIHVVVTYDGTIDSNNGYDRVKMFLNGTQDGTSLYYNKNELGDIVDGPGYFSFGGQVSSAGVMCAPLGYIGTLDDVMIYNRILSDEEIGFIFINE